MAVNELIAVAHCSNCGNPYAAEANFCARCGAALAKAASRQLAPRAEGVVRGEVMPAPAPAGGQTHVIIEAIPAPIQAACDNRWFVVGVLLCVGPIGLPALWISRRFSRLTKVLTTVGYFLLTVVAPIVVTWYFVDAALWPLVDIFNGVK